MNDLEATLETMLHDRAEAIEPRPGHREATLRGARRRRLVTAAAAVLVPLVVAAGALATIDQSSDGGPAHRPAAPDERTATGYSFTSQRGEYPFVATGEFRNAEWQMRVAAVSPDRDDAERITLQLQTPARNLVSTSSEVFEEQPLFVRTEEALWMFDSSVAFVFGAVDPEAETVEVWVNGINRADRTYQADLFEGYDSKTGVRADYFVAFVPHGLGLVIARDGDGKEVGVVTIPKRGP